MLPGPPRRFAPHLHRRGILVLVRLLPLPKSQIFFFLITRRGIYVRRVTIRDILLHQHHSPPRPSEQPIPLLWRGGAKRRGGQHAFLFALLPPWQASEKGYTFITVQ